MPPSSRRRAADSPEAAAASSSAIPAVVAAAAAAPAPAFRYEPNQAQSEKREVRKEYRRLIGNSEDARANMGEHKVGDLQDMIVRSDRLYESVKAPGEAVLDARLLLNTSETAAQLAKNMKVASGAFDIDEYLARIAGFIGGKLVQPGGAGHEADEVEEEDVEAWQWDRLGRAAGRCTKRAPVMDCLLGPLDVQANKRKTTKRARIEKEGPAIAPQQLQEEDIQRSENETTRLVRDVATLLEVEGGPEGLNLFRFVIDPTSFSNTVENLFYVSFLVRDGIVSLEDNDEGEPMLTSVEAPNDDDYAQGVTRRQLVLELDQTVWKELIELYDIRKPIIPSRQAAAAPRSGAWYG